jgi:hypothetical protein
MTQHGRAKSAHSLKVIQGGLAGEREWTRAEIFEVCYPTVKALPFVKLKKDHQPMWSSASFWCVKPSGRSGTQRKLGRSYARDLVAAMRADRCAPSVLAHVLQDIIRGRRRRNEGDVLIDGFLYELAEILMV